ncbi:substrate-binding domain-containing protein [Rubrobacter tropicus]|uniref:Substrate-binding domain-containing protein n=2 Tax=Rubrobacter tropicus TaxID=2653851 RepID=A0A6G8QFA1_9ACTN|nr:substrate-binding domain-containing protein [Rubrobacter tropicus]
MAEIAALAGVSKPTVSKVMNGQPGVAAATRERVERVIAERGYVRHSAARALSAGRAGSVNLVVKEIDNAYFSEIIRGVEETLERAGLSMVLTATHDEARRHRRWLARVVEHGTDGAILVLPDEHFAHLGELRRHGVPVALVDDRGESPPDVPSVGATNFAGGFAATEHLLSLGHRRIAMISGPAFKSTRERAAGYRTALQEAGIQPEPLLEKPGGFVAETGHGATRELLRLPDPPTAIFTGNDLQAMGVYRALYEAGLRAPDDVSVVGFDDLPFARLLTPALTTVRQPVREMGALATRMLLRVIAGEKLESARVELATSLIVRESSAPPRP